MVDRKLEWGDRDVENNRIGTPFIIGKFFNIDLYESDLGYIDNNITYTSIKYQINKQ